MYSIGFIVLCSHAAMDSFSSSGFVSVTNAMTLNKTMILFTSILSSLIFWKHYSGGLIEDLLLSIRCPSFDELLVMLQYT